MKKVYVFIALIMLIGFNVSLAKDKNKKISETKESKLKHQISHEVKYPAFASEQNLEGVVYVSFNL